MSIIILNDRDNVATCLDDIKSGQSLKAGGFCVTACEDIKKYHKIALTDIPKSGACYKYGSVIGVASADIKAGSHVHVHNIESTRGRGDIN